MKPAHNQKKKKKILSNLNGTLAEINEAGARIQWKGINGVLGGREEQGERFCQVDTSSPLLWAECSWWMCVHKDHSFFFFFLNNRLYIKLKKQFREFPGGPVVRTLPSSAVLCGCGPLHNSLSSALDYVLLPTCNWLFTIRIAFRMPNPSNSVKATKYSYMLQHGWTSRRVKTQNIAPHTSLVYSECCHIGLLHGCA